MRLNQVDLNLFVVFDAIYTERNLTRAAEVLFITQPAVSNALGRLRKTFNDQLFVRSPQGMVPTPVADNIIPRVREALLLLNTSVQHGHEFVPVETEKTYRFSMNDMAESLILAPLIERMYALAPGISIESYYVERDHMQKELTSGTLDFSIDIPLVADPQLCHTPFSTSRYVVMVRDNHPLVGDSLTMDQYLALKHIHVSSRRNGLGHVDMALNALGRQRQIQLRVQHYQVAPQILECSDLVLTVPLQFAQPFAQRSRLKIVELPLSVSPLSWHLYWHKSVDGDQANCWMREQILNLVE
jgi:DNA-binding transcriptional LysR family regulator